MSATRTIVGLSLSIVCGACSFLIIEPTFRATAPIKHPALPQQGGTSSQTYTSVQVHGDTNSVAAPVCTTVGSKTPSGAYDNRGSVQKTCTGRMIQGWGLPSLSNKAFITCASTVWASLLTFALMASHLEAGGLKGELQALCNSNCSSTAPKFRTLTQMPTLVPSKSPTQHPSLWPTKHPTLHPSEEPSTYPTITPNQLSIVNQPAHTTVTISVLPSVLPTQWPTLQPSELPTPHPTFIPSLRPTQSPTGEAQVCMVELDEQQIDEICSIEAHQILASNVLATKGDSEGYNYDRGNTVGPKIFGDSNPEIVIIGNSHCAHYGPVIEKLAIEYRRGVAMMCKDGVDGGPFHKPLSSWDKQRLGHLAEWKPRLVVWADFWAALAESGLGVVHSGLYDKQNTGMFAQYFGYKWNFAYTYTHLLEHASEILVLGDIPVLPDVPQSAGKTVLINKFYVRGKQEGFDFLLRMKESPISREVRLMVEADAREEAALLQFDGRIRFTEIASFFETRAPDFFLQLIDPVSGTLLYKDGNHINEDGAMRLEQLFRRELFDQEVCNF